MIRTVLLLALLAGCGADAPAAGSGRGNGQAGAAGASSAGLDIDGCAGVSVEAKVDVKPGNVLVLFDQSLTMGDVWTEPGGTSSPKYTAAGKALIGATGLDTLAKAGGTAADGCSVNCFLLPTDTAQLQEQLAKIVVETAGSKRRSRATSCFHPNDLMTYPRSSLRLT